MIYTQTRAKLLVLPKEARAVPLINLAWRIFQTLWPYQRKSLLFQKHIEHLIDAVRPIGQVKPKGGAEF
jgi:hypothetical protein